MGATSKPDGWDEAVSLVLATRPYLAMVIAAMRHLGEHPDVRTAAVTRSGGVYLHGPWWMTLTPAQRAGAVEHEAQHLARRHFDRRPAILGAEVEIHDSIAPARIVPGAVTRACWPEMPPDVTSAEAVQAWLDSIGGAAGCACCGGSGAGRPLTGETPESAEAAAIMAEAVATAADLAAAAPGADHLARALASASPPAPRRVPLPARSLALAVQRAGGGETCVRSWRRPRARGPVLTPRTTRSSPLLHVVVDVSGSMHHGALSEALAVLAGLRCHGDSVVEYWDTAMVCSAPLRSAVAMDVDAGGGTDMVAARAAAPDSAVVVIITDGACALPPSDDRTVVVIVRDDGEVSLHREGQ